MSARSDDVTIVDKPWGREIIYASCEHYLGKVIEISEGHRLSLQAHIEPGEAFRVRAGTVHRFAAPYGDVRVLEVSTPHPNDVVRFSDDYGRSPQ